MRPSSALCLSSGVIEPELAKHQQRRLHQVLLHAARTEGHRTRLEKAGVCDAAGALTSDWLRALPSVEPIHRFQVRNDPGLYLADAEDVNYRGITSGTRSETFVYFAGQEWNALRQSRRDEYLSWWGITAEHPIVNVASRLMPARPRDVAIGGTLDVERVLRRISRFRDGAFVLRGYPSRLGELAAVWLSLAASERGPAPRAVICTGEVLYAQQRALLEQAFRAPVIDEYGCHETGAAGFSCPEAGRLHLDGVRCLFEQVGDELVTTDLYNQVLPVVRYLCGDLVHIDDTACPCGRAGPTASVLGRTEDRVRIHGRLVPAGVIDLEPLPGVATYQVRVEGSAGLQVDAVRFPRAPAPVDLAERVAAWAAGRFGMPARVSLREPSREVAGGEGERPLAASWAHALLEEAWGRGLLALSPPEGPLGAVARLHQGVLTPYEMSNERGMSLDDCAALDRMLDGPPLGSVEDELLASRVLVWASAHRPFPDPLRCHAMVRRALERLGRAVEGARGSGVLVAAGVTDLQIGWRLLLPAGLAPADQVPPASRAQRLDALNAHHLLAALEYAWMTSSPSERPPALAKLHPLLPILISDAQSFAGELGAWLLPLLGAMLGRGGPVPAPPALVVGDLARRWWRFRMALCGSGASPEAALVALGEACVEPCQVARWQLETAYLALCRGQVSEPGAWLDLFHQAAPVLGQADGEANEIDLLPWIPLLRRLGPQLHRCGQPELAYQCLVLSTSPSSRISAFDRLTKASNIKQDVVRDDASVR